MAKKPKKEALVKIVYCKDTLHFPGLEKTVAVMGRGRMSAVDAEHFAREHCKSHGLIYVRCESFSRNIED